MFANNSCDVQKDLTTDRHTLPSFLSQRGRRNGFLLLIWSGAAAVILLSIFVFPAKYYLSLIPALPMVLRFIFLSKKLYPVLPASGSRGIYMPAAVSVHKWLTLSYLAAIIIDIAISRLAA